MSYITTYTGKHFDPAQPQQDRIDIRDIAHALSLICRGNGHVKTYFSVGQHCIHCALEAQARGYNRRLILACLLHDASECYLSDVPQPLKSGMPQYKEVEERLLEQIYIKYLGSALTEDEERLVKQVDRDMLYYDMLKLLGEEVEREAPVMATEFSYEVLPFEQVERQYLELFARYGESVVEWDFQELARNISGTFLEDIERIKGFFQLGQSEFEVPVVIYQDTDAYVAHLVQCGQSYQEWMIADTFDGRINVLTLEACRRSRAHADMDGEDYARVILHEFVHLCQQQVEPNCYGCIWFWEALATNLSGQTEGAVALDCNRDELMFHYHELPNAYAISYRLGKYMLEHLPYDQIYQYICTPGALWEDTEELLEAARRI